METNQNTPATAEGELQIDVFRFQAKDGGTLARSEESWEGLIASVLKGYSGRMLDKGIRAQPKVQHHDRGRTGVVEYQRERQQQVMACEGARVGVRRAGPQAAPSHLRSTRTR